MQVSRELLEKEEGYARIERAKAHLELEKNRINQLLSMLSDYSTIAALLAGCAVAGTPLALYFDV